MSDKLVKREEFNNYNLILLERNGAHILFLAISINFEFEDTAGQTWSTAGKQKFMQGWERAIESKWNSSNLYTSPKKGAVAFRVNVIPFLENSAATSKWTLTISKIKPGGFATSSVSDGFVWNSSVGDSEDLNPVSKGGSMGQRAAVHEFGHMIGLDDEYPDSALFPSWYPPANHTDTDSIMHSGEVIRVRHLAEFREWTKSALGE
ncbi:MAG: hypothetical protein AAGJ94_08480 [Pseudomonadota bacterium]